jgi:fibronectin-binding autotransporter adhesin
MKRIATTLSYTLLAVGVLAAAASHASAQLYWDSDATAGNNNIGTGAGLGGSGVWSNASANWFDGSIDAAWIANSDAVFAGAAGTVTLSFAKSANSLTFKTTGYTVGDNVSQVTVAGPYVTTDAGVTATIGAQLSGTAGLIKNGAGTLAMTNGNSYTGGTSITDGILVISADSSLGAVPTTGNPNGRDITLDGGTLRLNANVTINFNRQFMFGPNGGTIDTQSFPNSGYGFSHLNHGPGDLAKLGTGTWYAQGSGNANTLWTGRLIIKEGTWKIDNVSGLPYDIPAADGVKSDQIILDGGTLTRGSSAVNITNVRRGITVAAGGGTISGGVTWAGPVTSNVPNAVLNLNGVTLKSSAVPSTFQGTVNVGQSGLELNGGTAMGDTAAIVMSSIPFTPGLLTISGGTETIGSLSGGSASSGNITLNSTLVTGNNNNSTTYSGIMSGVVAAGLVKVGTGTFTLTNNNNYAGGTTINGGTLLVNNPPSTTGTGHSGTGSGTIVVNSGGTLGGTGNHNGAVIINDGGLANGPARIFGSGFYGGVTVNSGGTLAGNITISGPENGSLLVASGGHVAPGASIGTINADYLTLSAGSILDFELDTLLGVHKSDLINVLSTSSNALQLNGGIINLTNLGNMTVGTYTIIDYNSTMSGSISNLSFGTVPVGFSYSLNNNTTNKSIDLIVGVVPEPATWLLCAMAAAVFFYRAINERTRIV